jgi:hypothetical protein
LFVSSLEPIKVEQALEDPDWVVAIQEELNNFERNQVCELVEKDQRQTSLAPNGSFETSKMSLAL